MSNIDRAPDFDFLHQLADLAGETVLPLFRQPIAIENKLATGFDPVTDADKQAELKMRAYIQEHFPSHGILGEEFEAKDLNADGLWVLDPIDGTRAFISGLPTWGTLIGYRHSGGQTLGMMSQPFTGERFFGDGKQCLYKGPDGEKAISSRACKAISDATLFTTAPDIFDAEELKCFRRVEKAVRLSRYGVDCYAYCMLAIGMVDLVIEAGLKPVDIAPLIPVIEGAGGVVTNWQGKSAFDGGQVVATGDPALHDAVLELLSGKA
ncbi:histidinol-phosphatase [Cohaesibacter haloalkalitolerans]|uniref:histidinol-phosphatase n=1 Tax=Cohaesibacter haloalkalitolerans TaxID=1162980 RepID=UPI000E65B75E|nr:histidinol-phosphatase [Cohaesibacter haloalkalitolerans]